MTAELPPLDPTVAAAALELLPSRLQKRAEKLAADTSEWEINTDNGLSVTMGQATVTLIDNADGQASLNCDCLLAPKCAHIGAVCVASPVGEATSASSGDGIEAVDAGESSDADPSDNSAVPRSDAAWAKELPSPSDIMELVSNVKDVIDDIVEFGLGQLSIARHTQLLACVQKARVTGLPRLERALTALATNSQRIRLGKPVGRNDATINTLRVAFTCFLLERNPADREAIGQARRAYTTLDTQSGAGAGMFTPLYAEPIVASSGFAGVTVALATTSGDLYSVTKTPPGQASDVAGIWHGSLRLGDLHCNHAQLARKTLLITGGRSSSDGRIGSGRGVRAALGKDVTLDMVKAIPLKDGLALIEGTVVSIGLKGVVLETTNAGTVTLNFSVSAKKTELPNFVEACQRHLSYGNTLVFTCLVRDGMVLCVWPMNEVLSLPKDYGGRIFPGLDVVTPPSLTNTYKDSGSVFDLDHPIERGISDIVEPWLHRVVFGGAQAINSRVSEAQRDAVHLEQLGAPYAATLLERFTHEPQRSTHSLALAAYIRKI